MSAKRRRAPSVPVSTSYAIASMRCSVLSTW
jgi:hypothetical protein